MPENAFQWPKSSQSASSSKTMRDALILAVTTTCPRMVQMSSAVLTGAARSVHRTSLSMKVERGVALEQYVHRIVRTSFGTKIPRNALRSATMTINTQISRQADAQLTVKRSRKLKAERRSYSA